MNLAYGKRKTGHTLVEMLVSLFFFSLIGLIMLQLYIQGSNLWQLVTTQSELRSNARRAMHFMTNELKHATRAASGNPSPNLAIPSKPNNRSIDFYLPKDSDSDHNNLIIDDVGNTEWETNNKIQYQYIPGLKLLRRLEKGNQYTISNDVSQIEFEDNSIISSLYQDELKIILTVSKPVQGRTESVTLSSIIKLRN